MQSKGFRLFWRKGPTFTKISKKILQSVCPIFCSVFTKPEQTGRGKKGGKEVTMTTAKKIKKIWNAGITLIVVLLAVLAALIAGPRLFGIQVYSVLSGSMEPAFPTGSLLYVQQIDPASIQVGDPITFERSSEMPATHRVVRIDTEKQQFYTKGDNNEHEDAAAVPFQSLLGRPAICIPYLGYISNFIQHPPGLYLAIAAGAVLVLLILIPDLFDHVEKRNRRRSAQKDGPQIQG